MSLPTREFWLIAGPTAVGKSELALALAERIGGEIVSVDSMQVYRGMDIGTAKPSPIDRARVPHHLLDVADPGERYDAARFSAEARLAMAAIAARGQVPVLCGGTGFYFRALLEGLDQAPPADPALRRVLGQTPLSELLRELQTADPLTFERIDRSNPRPPIRAVEVIRLTGRPVSEQRAAGEKPGIVKGLAVHPRWFGLSREPGDLHGRIHARVDEMFRRGLVEETRKLVGRGLAEDATALQALGYRQVAEHLRGERSLEATVQLVKTRTRQYARKQMTWFRGQMTLNWLEISPGASAVDLLDRVLTGGRHPDR